MKPPLAAILFLAVVGFLAYATIASHAQRPCLVTATEPCTKVLQQEQK